MNIGQLGLSAWYRMLLCACMLVPTPVPAHAGAPFVTDDPGTTPPGEFEIDVAAIEVRARGEMSGALPSIEIDYGAGARLQLHVVALVAYTRPAGGRTRFGYGDTELGAKLRFLDEDAEGWRPSAAVYPLVEAPTGDDRQGLGTGRTRAFVPLWVGKSVAGWNIFGGGGYWFDPGPQVQNWWFVGVGATRKATEHLALGGEVFRASPRQSVGKEALGFDIGGILDVTAHHHVLLSLGRGIRNAAATNEFSGYLAYQLTF